MTAVTMATVVACAIGMATCAWLLVRRQEVLRPGVLLLAILLAVGAAAIEAAATGAMSPAIAAAIATGVMPISVPVFGLSRLPRRTATVAAVLWGGVLVPAAIVGPQLAARACTASGCVAVDFAGGLPFAIGAGAFVLVPSIGRPGAPIDDPRIRRPPLDVLLVATLLIGAVLWITALEGAIDRYTPILFRSAVLAGLCGAAGWFLVDRIRGLGFTTFRSVGLGLLAGLVSVLCGVASMATPWAALTGGLAGLTGALAHDARGLRGAPRATRAAVAALAIGALGTLVPGVLGTTLGFVFAARADVIVTQAAFTLGVAMLGLVLGAAVSVIERRELRDPLADSHPPAEN